MSQKYVISFVVCLVLLGPSGLALADSAILAWNPSGSDVAGYRLHYGTNSGIYTAAIDAGPALTVTVTNLIQDQTYYAVITSYNA
ncbi:MAG: fibronectin type III domain-containing protein, partial [Verrucomicrobia bacterium]|nr:fibronectin type III domain-containing protein [Verrucomicrobiota bacterium]